MDRIEHLTTQMKFRLNEGKTKQQSTAYYEIGVLDSGQVTGLKDHEIYETLAVIFFMAKTLDVKSLVSMSKVRVGANGFSCQVMVVTTATTLNEGDDSDRFLMSSQVEEENPEKQGRHRMSDGDEEFKEDSGLPTGLKEQMRLYGYF